MNDFQNGELAGCKIRDSDVDPGKEAKSHSGSCEFLLLFRGLSLVLIVLQVISGFFMLFFYVPTPEGAQLSISYLSTEVPLGWLMRNMHRWCATLLMGTLFTHMAVVFYLKAFRRPRELHWLSGVGQFLVVFFLLLTGVFLPWDWKAFWSFTILLDYLASWPVMGEWARDFVLDTFTINRIFITHIWILPLVLLVLLVFHVRMVRKTGISGPL